MCYGFYGRAFRVSPTPRIFKFTLSPNESKWIFAADCTFYLKCDSVIGDGFVNNFSALHKSFIISALLIIRVSQVLNRDEKR